MSGGEPFPDLRCTTARKPSSSGRISEKSEGLWLRKVK
jgi:hypothetical protein